MNRMNKKTAVLDVGGTFIKHALFIDGGIIPDSRQTTPIDEKADVQAVVDVLIQCAGQADQVSVCMPGPMDYTKGKSLMRHKFQALYNVELKPILEKRTGVLWNFTHDVVSYLAGVLNLGEGHEAHCPAAVTLGTGLGYAFAKDGIIQKNELGSPVHPLWNQPCGEGIVEDFVSARGLTKQYEKLTGRHLSALKISQHAQAGEMEAVSVFTEMGTVLGAALEERIHEDGIDLVILGGQVSRSAELFLPHLQRELSIPVIVTKHLNDAPLYGAFSVCTQE